MTWQDIMNEMIAVGYSVKVEIEENNVRICCGDGGLTLQTRLPLVMVENSKIDLIKCVLESMWHDLECARSERSEDNS